jgi:hypothetical protein
MTIPRVALETSAPEAGSVSISPGMHEVRASTDTAVMQLPDDATASAVAEWTLSGGSIDPVVVARAALQARLQEDISRRELARERERTKALEALVAHLTTELKATREVVAKQNSGFRGFQP